MTHTLKHGSNNSQLQRPLLELPLHQLVTRDILHKNSYYYNQDVVLNEYPENIGPRNLPENSCCCEWDNCRAPFLCTEDLLRHVQNDHIAWLPVSNTVASSGEAARQRVLRCLWKRCHDPTVYHARYKLMVHLQRMHFNGKDKNKDKVRTSIEHW